MAFCGILILLFEHLFKPGYAHIEPHGEMCGIINFSLSAVNRAVGKRKAVISLLENMNLKRNAGFVESVDICQRIDNLNA